MIEIFMNENGYVLIPFRNSGRENTKFENDDGTESS